jgi:hypothetical protein
VEILNYSTKTKTLLLSVLLAICEQLQASHSQAYQPSFEDYIKLRILALDDSLEECISKPASKLLALEEQNIGSISTTIANFNMKTFIKNNNKDTI